MNIIKNLINKGKNPLEILQQLSKNSKIAKLVQYGLLYGYTPMRILQKIAKAYNVDIKETDYNTPAIQAQRAKEGSRRKGAIETAGMLGTAAGIGALATGGFGRLATALSAATSPPEEEKLDPTLEGGMNKISEYVRKLAKAGRTAPFIHVTLMRNKKLKEIANKYEMSTQKRIYDYIANLAQVVRGETQGAKGQNVLAGLNQQAAQPQRQQAAQPQGQQDDIFSAMDNFEQYL